MKNIINISRYFILIIFITLYNNTTVSAQIGIFNTSEEIQNMYSKYMYKPGSNFHPSIQPYDYEEITSLINFDTLFATKKNVKNNFINKFLHENLIVIQHRDKYNDNFNVGIKYKQQYKPKITINPVINIIAGVESDNETRAVWEVGAGIMTTGNIRKNLSFNFNISLNQAVFQQYLYHNIYFSKAIPGLGYAYATGKDSCFRFLNSNFLLAWQLSRNFKFETGYGKHFFGDGYRSMMLSWNAPPYPYFKITSNIWKFKYVNLLSLYNDSRNITSASWNNYKYKASATHHISINIAKRINLGLFETVIWDINSKRGDTRRIIDPYYLNPVIFYRPVEFSIGSPDNVIMGFNGRITIGQKNALYGQFVLDEFVLNNFKTDLIAFVKRIVGKTENLGNYGAWTNKQAYQLGLKSFDIFGIKSLNMLLEVNAARPFTYSHRRPIKNYSHYGQSLAHPLGANFVEGVMAFKYTYKRLSLSVRGIAANTGLDGENQHNGQDIFKPTYDTYEEEYNNIPVTQLFNVIGQGISTNIINATIKSGYLINPVNNLRLELGVNLRNINCEGTSNNSFYIFAGIKTGIEQYYRDF